MLELADIFRAYGPAYRTKYGDRMPPSHIQALWDIEHCRTPDLGGEVYWCPQCEDYLYSYHSCGNRHCPKCESDRADTWRDKQLATRLPVPYFLVTFTLPHTLNSVARSHQKLIYDLLFQTSAGALQTLARNPDWVGGQIGMVGVLPTWDRSMGYHLHIHYLVPAGGIDPTTGDWKPSHPKFLVPGSALRTVVRAKFRDALKQVAPDLFAQVPPQTWTTPWVVHGQAVGDGRAALKSLAPYVYRVALSNRRLVRMADGKVTFRYKPRKQPWKTMTLNALSFIQRFLQHVLPKGFQKVRSFGFRHPAPKRGSEPSKRNWRLRRQPPASRRARGRRSRTPRRPVPTPRTRPESAHIAAVPCSTSDASSDPREARHDEENAPTPPPQLRRVPGTQTNALPCRRRCLPKRRTRRIFDGMPLACPPPCRSQNTPRRSPRGRLTPLHSSEPQPTTP